MPNLSLQTLMPISGTEDVLAFKHSKRRKVEDVTLTIIDTSPVSQYDVQDEWERIERETMNINKTK